MKKITAVLCSSVFLLGFLVFFPKEVYAQPEGCINPGLFGICDNPDYPYGCRNHTYNWCCIDAAHCIPPTPIPTPTPEPGNGAWCRANGGECRTTCQTGEYGDSPWDCLQAGITGGQTCCFPSSVTPIQRSCGESCINASQCPSQCPACQELVQGQGKVCRIAGGITPAPGPGGGTGGSIRTAIGDIDPRNLQSFVRQLLNLAFGVAGGVAFLLMLFGVFQVMTSSGNPEKMKSGSELITSALTGLLFIVFSIFILKLIGVQILDIPGFGQR